jgi:hypothetical protein
MHGAWGAFWIALGIHEVLVQWLLANAMMLAASSGRVLPRLGKLKKDATKPGAPPVRPVQPEWGEPRRRAGAMTMLQPSCFCRSCCRFWVFDCSSSTFCGGFEAGPAGRTAPGSGCGSR